MRTDLAFVLPAAIFIMSACSAAAPETRPAVPPLTTSPVSANDPPSPTLRLPAGVTPVHESVELNLKPSEDVFHGAIDLEIRVTSPTSFVWLNGTELDIRDATLIVGSESEGSPARVVRGNEGFIGFGLNHEIPAGGTAHLRIHYDGHVSPKDDRGVFRETEDEKPYLFSQFENTEARRAFPCFDEPGFKYPWKLTIKVKKGDVAVSNTPIETQAPEGPDTVVRFAETKPLPAYLVAFAVGPFAFVDGGKSKSGTPVRIVTPTGRESEAEYAAKTTAPIIDELEKYFGIKYPYPKMDIVPIPHLVSFGAMENAGMITIGMGYSLAKKGDDTLRFQRIYTDIMAHEMSHQWFGDFVTTAWWDDIWLNEGFATWMGNKIVQRMHPEWHFEFSRLRDASGAMDQDALISARKIRQEIKSDDDIQNAFDGITYEKGATIIGMFEHSVGEAAFQKGIQRYLNTHAYGLATSADFLSDVSQGSGTDVTAAFSTFLDRPGLPLLHATLDCKAGAELHVTEERYLPIGSKGSTEANWQLPVCATFPAETSRFQSAKGEVTACGTIGPQGGTIRLGNTCPKWVMPNASAAGYYRVAYTPSDLKALLGKGSPITALERMSVALDVTALARAGKLEIGDALGHISDLADDPNINVSGTGISIANVVRDVFLTDDQRAPFAKLLEKAYGPKGRALGWKPRPNDTPEDRLQRRDVVGWLADRADDPELVKQALALANGWLDDERSLEEDAITGVLTTAAEHGDRKLYDRMLLEAKKAKDDHRRGLILNAMSDFRDPAISVDSMGLMVGDEFDIRESVGLLFGGDYRNYDARFGFVKKSYDALIAKIPNDLKPEITSVGRGFCDEAHRADVEAFFTPRMTKVTGGPRKLAQALESIGICIAQKNALAPGLKAFLKR